MIRTKKNGRKSFSINKRSEDSREKSGIDDILLAITMIKKKEGNKRGVTGKIECPACGEDLNYSIAEINGHIWGRCTNKNCIVWAM